MVGREVLQAHACAVLLQSHGKAAAGCTWQRLGVCIVAQLVVGNLL